MLQATGYPAEIADFYSTISARYGGVFSVAKIMRLGYSLLPPTLLLTPRFEYPLPVHTATKSCTETNPI